MDKKDSVTALKLLIFNEMFLISSFPYSSFKRFQSFKKPYSKTLSTINFLCFPKSKDFRLTSQKRCFEKSSTLIFLSMITKINDCELPTTKNVFCVKCEFGRWIRNSRIANQDFNIFSGCVYSVKTK